MEKWPSQADITAIADGPPHDTAQHITPSLIGGQNTVTDQKGGCPAVICNHLHGHFIFPGIGLFLSGKGFHFVHNRHEKIGFIVGWDILEHRYNTFQTKAGVNARLWQRGHVSGFILFKLHEYKIPQLKIAVTFASHGTIGVITPKFRASINMNLAARTAGSGISH